MTNQFTEADRAHALMQGEQNAATDAYIDARPQLDSIHNRRIFEAGFERGWNVRSAQLETLRQRVDRLTAENDSMIDRLAAMVQGEPVFIVFDGAPGPTAPSFIEVETADGKSMSAGDWHDYPKDIAMDLGLWRLGPFYTAAPTIPEGYVLVPVEPTEEMLQHGFEDNEGSVAGMYCAMLLAAPKHTKDGQ